MRHNHEGSRSKLAAVLERKIEESKRKRTFSIYTRGTADEQVLEQEFEGIDVFLGSRTREGEEPQNTYLLLHKRTGVLLTMFFGRSGSLVFKTAITRDGQPPHTLRHKGRQVPMIEGQLSDVVIEENGSMIWRWERDERGYSTTGTVHHAWGKTWKTSWRNLPTVSLERLHKESQYEEEEEEETEVISTMGDIMTESYREA